MKKIQINKTAKEEYLINFDFNSEMFIKYNKKKINKIILLNPVILGFACNKDNCSAANVLET